MYSRGCGDFMMRSSASRVWIACGMGWGCGMAWGASVGCLGKVWGWSGGWMIACGMKVVWADCARDWVWSDWGVWSESCIYQSCHIKNWPAMGWSSARLWVWSDWGVWSERYNLSTMHYKTDLWRLPELTGRATTGVMAVAIRRKVTERLIWTMLNKEMSGDECKVNEVQPGESGTWVDGFISKCSHPCIFESGARNTVDSQVVATNLKLDALLCSPTRSFINLLGDTMLNILRNRFETRLFSSSCKVVYTRLLFS